MKRTQLQLDEPVFQALRRKAYAEHTSVAGVVREAIAEYLTRGSRRPPAMASSAGRGFEFEGIGSSPPDRRGPVSIHHGAVLADHIARSMGRRAKR